MRSILNFPFKIGRMSNNDIVFEDKRVSRYHAEIRMKNAAYVIRDLGSHNGIQRVKGKTMDPCVYEVLL